MALVPFRVSGQAASQQLDSQLLQVGPFSLLLHQRPKDSGNTAHLTQAGQEQREGMLQEQVRSLLCCIPLLVMTLSCRACGQPLANNYTDIILANHSQLQPLHSMVTQMYLSVVVHACSSDWHSLLQADSQAASLHLLPLLLQSGSKDHLTNVGLVLWQSGFVLADFLLLRLPQLQHSASSGPGIWSGVRVLELGCGCGTVGMFLALAGAQVTGGTRIV